MNLYEMYVDGDKFYDVRIQELALIDPVLEMSLNAAGTLTFTVPPEHPKAGSFKPMTSTIEVFRDGEWMWEGRIIDDKADFNNCVTYTCEGCLAYLNDSVQPQKEYSGVTTWSYVEQILAVHNSQVEPNRQIINGAVTVRDPNNVMSCYTNFNHTLQELKEDIIDDLGGYIRFRKVNGQLYMDILDDWPRTNSQQIRIGENLIDLSPTHDYSDIASVIIPLGATLEDQEEHEEGLEPLDKYVEITEVNDGKNYIAHEELLEDYGRIWQVVRFDGIHFPELLLKKAEDYFVDGRWGEMVIEAKAFDLNYTSEEFQEFQMLDKVRVISEVHGLDRYFPITAQTIYFNNVSQNTITLGGTGEPVSITGVTNQVTVNTEKLDERIKDPNRLIEQAIWQATQLIEQGLNGYVRVNENEILIMDTDDPETAKHVWRWNMGGLGYSNNGYHGPFETAITMDGTIVGKFLAANSVAAEQLDVNYRSHVEELIVDAEDNANLYTDGKLKDYPTRKEQETYFKTEADKIVAGVNTTLENYYTSEQIESKLEILESSIKSSVTASFNSTLDGYPTFGEMSSAIEQKANSITSTVTSTLRSYSTTTQVQSMIDQMADQITLKLSSYATDSELRSLEAKITTDGIFATINSGLAGSESISNTKFSITRSGITVQGGGLTIKNNSGTNVLSADTSGNLTLTGAFTTRSTTSSSGWRIEGDYIYHYSGSSQTLSISDSTLGSSGNRCTRFQSYNQALVLSSMGSSMNIILDSNGIIFDTSNGRGNIYINQGGVNYPGVTDFADTEGRFVLQFMHGICYSITQY